MTANLASMVARFGRRHGFVIVILIVYISISVAAPTTAG